jgi:hypothetical protein
MEIDKEVKSQPKSGWLTFNGKKDAELEERVFTRLSQSISEGSIRTRDLDYLRRYELALLNNTVNLSDTQLELLRKLTASWDLKGPPLNITSHRPIVGRFIVLAKRLLFPLVRAALKDELNQQRAFNGAVVEFLAASGGVGEWGKWGEN